MTAGPACEVAAGLAPKVFQVADGKGGRRFRVERMLPEHYAQCVEMATDAFLTRNEVFKVLGVTERAFRDFAGSDLKACMGSGLSLVAVDDTSGQLAAFLFIEQFNAFDMHTPKDAKMQVAYRVGERLYKSAIRKGTIRKRALLTGKMMHVNTGGTAAEYEGTGAGMALRSYVEEHARSHGFQWVCVEPANPATRHIWENKLGYSVTASTVLADFVDADRAAPWKGCSRVQEMAVCVKTVQDVAASWSTMLLPIEVLISACKKKPRFAFSLVA